MSSKHFFKKLLILVFTLLWISNGTATAEMKFYDADNQFLGIYYGSTDGPLIYLPTLDMFVNIKTDETASPKGQYADASILELYYSSSDCSGIPYVYGGAANAKAIFKVGVNHRVVDTSSSATFTPGSYLNKSGVCQIIINGENAFFHPLLPVTLPFSTPVKNPLHWEYTESKSKVVVVPLLGN